MQNEQLCELCRRYSIRSWSLPSDFDVPDSQEIYDPADSGVRLNFRYAFENRVKCAFCKLIVNSLWLNPDCCENIFSHERSHVRLTLYKVGSVVQQSDQRSEALNAKETEQNLSGAVDRRCSKTVRYLKIQGYDASGMSWGLPVGNIYMTQVYLKHDNDAPILDNLLHTTGPPARLVDYDRARYFMNTCQKHHQGTCALHAHDRHELSLRVIDVKDMKIVWLPHDENYAALSYCWGPTSTAQSHLLTTNKEKLFETSSLLETVKLPDTIADALTVCRNLDISYLWVDALCIIQDDVEDKLTQINQMDKIYMYADVTIVAAGGDNAWSGLHGVRTHRESVAIDQSFEALTLCSWYPPETAYNRTISTSPWTNRAWTLQEQILSRRRLVFGQHQMVWHCEAAYWPETFAIAEACDIPGIGIEIGDLPTRGQNPPADTSAFQRYTSMLAEASSRKLGFEEDRLLCVQGILNVLSTDFPAGFLWGMPKDVFDSTMLFCASPFGDGAPYDRRRGFPSWSWTGWKTQVTCSVTSPYMYGFSTIEAQPGHNDSRPSPKEPDCLRKEVVFHTVDPDTTGWVVIASDSISSQGSFYYWESLKRWMSSDTADLLRRTRTLFAEYNVPLDHALAFWTQSAYFEVDQTVHREFMKRFDEVAKRGQVPKRTGQLGRDDSNPGWGYAVREPGKQIVGYISLQKEYRAQQSEKLRFIAVSHNRRWTPYGFGPFFDLMHVEERNGITYRVQMMHDSAVTFDVWQSASPSWECVVMA